MNERSDPTTTDPVAIARFASEQEITALPISVLANLAHNDRLTDAEFRRLMRVWGNCTSSRPLKKALRARRPNEQLAELRKLSRPKTDLPRPKLGRPRKVESYDER